MANYTVKDVWEKADTVLGCNPDEWRKDQKGAWIYYNAYGDRTSDYGWEIDHITPLSNGGQDILSNVRPLHWRNNVAKSNGWLKAAVTSVGNKNVIL